MDGAFLIMVSAITDARIDVAAGLTDAGMHIIDHIPGRVAPPVVLIGTGDPYLQQLDANTFDATQFQLRLELFAIAGTATNEVAIAQLETMVEQIIINLGDWTIENVSPPFMASANDAQYLTSRITITNQITLGANNA